MVNDLNSDDKGSNHEDVLGWREGFVLSGSICFEKIIIFYNERMRSDGTYLPPDGTHGVVPAASMSDREIKCNPLPSKEMVMELIAIRCR